MKAVRETIRKYYKYIVTEWTQPVITSNGTMGSSSFACYPKDGGSGYAAFDGNTSSYWYHYAQSDHLKWISFYSAAPLKISALHLIFDNVNRTDLFYSHPSTYLFANVNNGNGWNTNAAGYNSGSPNSNWVRLGSVGSTGSAEYDLACTENEGYYNYFQLIVNLANSRDNHDGIALKECQITANYIDSVETSIDDYDFYKDVSVYKVVKELVRKYYKYKNWEQPIMSANTQDGVSLSATNFNSNNLYILMNGVSNSDYICPTSTSSYGSTFTINLDYYVRLNQFSFNYYRRTNENYGLTSFKVVAVVDGNEVDITPSKNTPEGWSTLTSQVNNLTTNCIKISCSTGGSPYVRIGEITLQGDIAEETTEQDYDFYEDIDVYKAVKF